MCDVAYASCLAPLVRDAFSSFVHRHRDFGTNRHHSTGIVPYVVSLTRNWEPFLPRLLHPRLLAANFERNLGIMGGLMMIAAYGSGIYLLSDRVYPL